MTDTIGDRLKAARDAKGLSQEALSKRSGVPAGHISRIEKGVRPDPQISTVVKMARALGLSIDVLTDLRRPGQNETTPPGDDVDEIARRVDLLTRLLRKVADAAGVSIEEELKAAPIRRSSRQPSAKKRAAS